MPESITDRPTRAHEYLFLLTKSGDYFYDHVAVKEPVADRAQKSGRPVVRDFVKAAESFGAGTSASRKYAGGGFYMEDGLRNRRSVWTFNSKPYRGAHFATMPPALADVCIKAGSSEKGCCPTCGAPWARVVERSPGNVGGPNHSYNPGRPDGMVLRGGRLSSGAVVSESWEPTCDCPEHEPVPCLILDPFSGSGTTGYVANRLGRNYVGTDLNPDYLPLAEARLRGEDPPEDEPEGGAEEVVPDSVLALFGG